MSAEQNDFENLIKKIASQQNFHNLEIRPISSEGNNYTSKLFSVTVKDEKELKLFAKAAYISEKLRAQCPLMYEIEIFAFTKIFKIYDMTQDECNVPTEQRLSLAKYYGGDAKEYEEIILLEDLVAQGFSTYNRLQTIDWEYAKAAIEELAKFHALSIAYRISKPKEFDDVVDFLRVKLGAYRENMTFCFAPVNEAALKNVREENKARLEAFFAKFDMAPFWEVKCLSLVHGDFKCGNLMHRKRDDGSVEIKIADLQTLQGGSPLADLLYFIFTGSDQGFRTQYYERLIEHYYTELSAAMTRLRLQPELVYSREDFYQELKEKLPYGLAMAVFVLPSLTVELEKAHVVGEETDMEDFFSVKTSALYTVRINEVVDDFVKWGVL